MSSQANMIKVLMAGKVAVGSEVIVEGWVRTRRDSKAGISFIAVSDGTCFATIQVVAESGCKADLHSRSSRSPDGAGSWRTAVLARRTRNVHRFSVIRLSRFV